MNTTILNTDVWNLVFIMFISSPRDLGVVGVKVGVTVVVEALVAGRAVVPPGETAAIGPVVVVIPPATVVTGRAVVAPVVADRLVVAIWPIVVAGRVVVAPEATVVIAEGVVTCPTAVATLGVVINPKVVLGPATVMFCPVVTPAA